MITQKAVPTWYTRMQSFVRLSGRINARVSSIKKYLLNLQDDFNKSVFAGQPFEEVFHEIRDKLSRKAKTKSTYVNIPKWERFVNKCKNLMKTYKKTGFVADGYNGLGDVIAHYDQNTTVSVDNRPCKHKGRHFHVEGPDCDVVILSNKIDQIFEGNIKPAMRRKLLKWMKENKKMLLREAQKVYDKKK